jgi:hypothetical protein
MKRKPGDSESSADSDGELTGGGVGSGKCCSSHHKRATTDMDMLLNILCLLCYRCITRLISFSLD